MLRSKIYTINSDKNFLDDGSKWIQKMSEFNNSRAFNYGRVQIINSQEQYLLFLYLSPSDQYFYYKSSYLSPNKILQRQQKHFMPSSV